MAKYRKRTVHVKDKRIKSKKLRRPQNFYKPGFKYNKFKILFVPREIREKNIWFAHKLETLVWLAANLMDLHPRDIIYSSAKKAGAIRQFVIFMSGFCNIAPSHIKHWADFNGLNNTSWSNPGVARQAYRKRALESELMKQQAADFIRYLDKRNMIDLRGRRMLAADDVVSLDMDFDTPPNFWEHKEEQAL